MHITKSGSNAYHKSGSNAYHKVAVMHIRSNKYGGTTRRREDEWKGANVKFQEERDVWSEAYADD